jgi:hypothetical protein
MICKHCKDQLTVDRGVLIDSTGGDVCGIASVADENPPNENMPHETIDIAELEELQKPSQKGQGKVKRCHSKSN